MLPDDMHQQVDRICRVAPPHVWGGVMAQVGLPAPVIWVELPTSTEGEGAGIFAQVGDGQGRSPSDILRPGAGMALST